MRKAIIEGYTLIETMLIIFIIATLLILCWPILGRLRSHYELETAVWEIHSKMNYLKYLALKDSQPYRLKIISPAYLVEKFDSLSSEWKLIEKKIFNHVYLEANNSPTFYPEGTVSNLTSITIANTSGKYRITLAISGRIKVIRLS